MSRIECRELSSVSENIAVAIFRVNIACAVAAAVFFEVLDNFQHPAQLIPESGSCTFVVMLLAEFHDGLKVNPTPRWLH
jgi:hypothetical protein